MQNIKLANIINMVAISCIKRVTTSAYQLTMIWESALKTLWARGVLALLEKKVVDVLGRSELMVGYTIIDLTIWIVKGMT